ncbi:hypothetical protein EVAR_64438_1 [Eumeta japonica]|uniref:Uncharacterized protein n=1 Tax=Eumeta variegata TaxID=151549 RepID=A0A4C1YNM7_EUMVA|nr:hypothetical protein EVAR_64438_1 [Eumeta japonica]
MDQRLKVSAHTGFDPDHGRIDRRGFDLSQVRPVFLCLGGHFKPSVLEPVIASLTRAAPRPRAPRAESKRNLGGYASTVQ